MVDDIISREFTYDLHFHAGKTGNLITVHFELDPADTHLIDVITDGINARLHTMLDLV